MLWESVANSRWFQHTTFILLLNKMVMFTELIVSGKLLGNHPSDFQGTPRNVFEAQEYIKLRFTSMVRSEKEIDVYCTTSIGGEEAKITTKAVEKVAAQRAYQILVRLRMIYQLSL